MYILYEGKVGSVSYSTQFSMKISSIESDIFIQKGNYTLLSCAKK
jgi:hypothetical protein